VDEKALCGGVRVSVSLRGRGGRDANNALSSGCHLGVLPVEMSLLLSRG